MSLREAAISASDAQQKQQGKKERERREAALEEVKKRWNDRWGSFPEVPEIPHEFTWAKVDTDSRRDSVATGWRFTVDDVDFISPIDGHYRYCHMVILTCPDCGKEYCTSFYGLDNLGKLLKTQRSISHTCYERSLRELAYEIRSASLQTGLAPREAFDEAWGRHHETIARDLMRARSPR